MNPYVKFNWPISLNLAQEANNNIEEMKIDLINCWGLSPINLKQHFPNYFLYTFSKKVERGEMLCFDNSK